MKKIKVLFLAANPLETSQLRLDEEIRAINEKIRFQITSIAGSPATASQPPAKAKGGGMTWQVGERVFVYRPDDEYWYSVTIEDLGGKRVHVRFDDGYQKWMTQDNPMKMNVKAGDSVECRWQGELYYYPAHIIELEGERLLVEYDYKEKSAHAPTFGEQEWTTVSMVRITR
jgi:hypothetical protein